MKPINICVPTYKRKDLLLGLYESLLTSTILPTSLIIIDNGNQNIQLPKDSPFDIKIILPGFNSGFTKSCNFFLNTLEDFIIIANDDTRVFPNTIERLVVSAEENENDILFCTNGHDYFYWSFFLQKKKSIELVGNYDENMLNYWSDLDYRRRMKIKGFSPFVVQQSSHQHVIGGTLESQGGEELKRRNDRYNLDEEYFKLKWGQDSNREIGGYSYPFNLKVENETIS